jgi:hypothetical protein
VPLSIEITQSAADGKALCVGDLRAFLAECDRVGIPADLRLRGDTSFRGWLRAVAAEQVTEESSLAAPKPAPARGRGARGRSTASSDASEPSAGKNGESGRRQR